MYWADLNDDDAAVKARLFLILALLIALGSIVGALLIMVKVFLQSSAATNAWTGIAVFVQCLLIFIRCVRVYVCVGGASAAGGARTQACACVCMWGERLPLWVRGRMCVHGEGGSVCRCVCMGLSVCTCMRAARSTFIMRWGTIPDDE